MKAVVLDPENGFNVDRTLTKADVEKLIKVCTTNCVLSSFSNYASTFAYIYLQIIQAKSSEHQPRFHLVIFHICLYGLGEKVKKFG